ncbi:MAG: 8-oxoguanine DNA glycosylase, partial [Lachnospiraceae bacterium]|nr:8-oxoguanine DNA glycosylase [Lachnospiraceae bacterium]
YGQEHPELLALLPKLSYAEAMEELVRINGIGPKVANCVCLFGLHHVEAFPIDTHVRQLLDKYYPDGFDYEYYGGNAGIIQQYLFYYELKHKGK